MSSSGSFENEPAAAQELPLRSRISLFVSIRDFAYPAADPAHVGIFQQGSGGQAEDSNEDDEDDEQGAEGGMDDGSEAYMNFSIQRRLSDTLSPEWNSNSGQWSAGGEPRTGSSGVTLLPQATYHDGPPWSEDEDLHSPVVSSSKHRKHKSTGDSLANSTSIQSARYKSGNGQNTRRFSKHQDGPSESARHASERSSDVIRGSSEGHGPVGRDKTFENRSDSKPAVSGRVDADWEAEGEGDDSESIYRDDPSRYSRDYQFTIASEDEEMHGKAVALFDFEKKNENELPLVEGQVIWVSYRHGQGWLVAEDPKTGENGLVPEEYVRLLRDLHGNWDEDGDEGSESIPNVGDTAATQPTSSTHHPAAVSTFSTSSKDLDPYPQHLLGKLASPTATDDKGKHPARGPG